MNGDVRRGVGYAFAAYGWWGLMPLYFRAVQRVPAGEILIHRIVGCTVLLTAVMAAAGRSRDLVVAFRSPVVLRTFAFTSVLLSVNWLIYIYGIASGQTVETSLGYFINPLFSVILGMIYFGERLRPGQVVAIALATAGVIVPVVVGGRFPWIALALASSFGIYGMIRKSAPADALLGLTIETAILVPAAIGYQVYLVWAGQSVVGELDGVILALLLLSGLVTAVPLFCFGHAARLLPLSMLGFIQYLAPTLQFLTAVTLFGEAVSPMRWASFGLIWSALAIYTAESLVVATRKVEPAVAAPLD